MKKLQTLRGFRDTKWNNYSRIYNIFLQIAKKYNLQEIKTPTLENSELFIRGVGTGTDIVDKEMFSFDYEDETLVLVPEGTSSVVRYCINEGTFNQKLFYFRNFFRKERPQKGRYREFYQIGVEIIGKKSIFADLETLNLAIDLFKIFNVDFKVKINDIGTPEERKKYVELLKNYFKENYENLSETSKDRFNNSKILRILDSKEDAEIIKNAPKMTDFIGDKESFQKIQDFLNDQKIEFEIDPCLVRGLDYYNNLVFEFIAKNFEGSQNVICGGGRYDGLFETLGGQKTAAVGFGIGVDRLIEVAEIPDENIPKILLVTDNYNDRYQFNNINCILNLLESNDKEISKIKSDYDFVVYMDNQRVFDTKNNNYLNLNDFIKTNF